MVAKFCKCLACADPERFARRGQTLTFLYIVDEG